MYDNFIFIFPFKLHRVYLKTLNTTQEEPTTSVCSMPDNGNYCILYIYKFSFISQCLSFDHCSFSKFNF